MPHETAVAPAPSKTTEPEPEPEPNLITQMIGELTRLVRLPFETLGTEVTAGRRQTEAGIEQIGRGQATGLIDLLLGSLRAVGAPVTAGARTLADPASRLLQAATGMEEPTRESLQTGMELSLSVLGPASATRLIPRLAKTPAVSTVARPAVAKPIRPAPAEAIPSPAKPPISLGEAPLIESRVSSVMTGRIAEASEEALRGSLDTSKRLFRNIQDALEAGEISVESLPDLLRRSNLTARQFSEFYAETVSASGRTLQQLSVLSKRLQAVFNEEPEAAAALEKLSTQTGPLTTWDRIVGAWRKIDEPRRALLVSQWVTAVRNAWSQAARYTIDAADSALTAAFEGRGARETIQAGLENFHAVARKLSPAGRQRLETILDEFPLEAQQLSATIAGEATLGLKLSSFINPLNKLQEGFFRTVAFDSKLRQLARKQGLDLEALAPNQIPGDLVTQAVDHALEVTFAKTPGAGQPFARAVMGLYRELPFLTTINPFPRFATNAARYLWEFNPARLLTPAALRTIATGTPEEAAKVMSRAMIGTVQLSTALAIRGSALGGERWYEIKIPGTDRRIDTRAFGPFSLYLLIAEAMAHPEKLKVEDLAKGLVGINRIAGTGLIVTDLLRTGAVEQKLDLLYQFAGQYFGGFAVPFRNLKAAVEIGGTEESRREEPTFRDVRDRPLIDPFLSSIPGVSRTLPESKSALHVETRREETPGLRLATGLNIKTKNLIEQEGDRLGLEFRQLQPRTGIPAWDREIAAHMAPEVERQLPALLTAPQYQRAQLAFQRYIFRGALTGIRKQAVQQAAVRRPDLFAQATLKGLDPDLRELLEINRKGVPPGRLLELLK